TGNRIQGGTVLAGLEFFTVVPGKPVAEDIRLRKDPLPAQGNARISMDEFLTASGLKQACSLPGGKGTIAAWLEPGKEPTRHLVAEMKSKKAEFGKFQGTLVFILPDAASLGEFRKANGADLPGNLRFSSNFNGSLEMILKARHETKANGFPVVLFLDTGGEIRYYSEGYRIGLADDLARFLK
ncbi:MAG TPA: hypothetical protein VMC08_04150, partial [Bacteroidales bacterium]|nr:hypothetical protein [Bacteroidales bacterium]